MICTTEPGWTVYAQDMTRQLSSVHRIEIHVHAQNDSTQDSESNGIEENGVFIISFTAK